MTASLAPVSHARCIFSALTKIIPQITGNHVHFFRVLVHVTEELEEFDKSFPTKDGQ